MGWAVLAHFVGFFAVTICYSVLRVGLNCFADAGL
jgi:hypothetical protein